MEWFRRGEFQRHWTRNFLFLYVPGFALFAAGIVTTSKPVIVAGWAVCLVGMARGYRILRKYKVCPSCRKFNKPRLGDDEYICQRCGAGLPGDEEMTVF